MTDQLRNNPFPRHPPRSGTPARVLPQVCEIAPALITSLAKLRRDTMHQGLPRADLTQDDAMGKVLSIYQHFDPELHYDLLRRKGTSDDDPLTHYPLTPFLRALRTNLYFLADGIRNLTNAQIAWEYRLFWLEQELRTSLRGAHERDTSSPFRDLSGPPLPLTVQHDQLEQMRSIFAEDPECGPYYWDARLTKDPRQERYEALTPLHQLGAQLLTLRNDPQILRHVQKLHLQMLVTETRKSLPKLWATPQNAHYLDSVPSGFEVSYDKAKILELTEQLCDAVTTLITTSEKTQGAWRTTWNAYTCLCATTTFAEHTPARTIGLSLVEYHPATDGCLAWLIPTVQEIFNELVIDPQEPGPQKGFGRRRTNEELQTILSPPGTRVALLCRGEAPIGFAIFVPGASKDALPKKELISELRDRGFLDPTEEKAGFLSFMGILEPERRNLQASGLWGAQLLDQMIDPIGLTQRCDINLLTVRVGHNPNPARDSTWIPLGWHLIGYRIGPLEVLIRRTPRGMPRWFTTLVNERSRMVGFDKDTPASTL